MVIVNVRNKYIESKIVQRRGGDTRKQETHVEPEQPSTATEDDLYQTPAFLKVKKGLLTDEDAGDRWLTGIAEVPLSIE